jgi:hypothetical protein
MHTPVTRLLFSLLSISVLQLFISQSLGWNAYFNRSQITIINGSKSKWLICSFACWTFQDHIFRSGRWTRLLNSRIIFNILNGGGQTKCRLGAPRQCNISILKRDCEKLNCPNYISKIAITSISSYPDQSLHPVLKWNQQRNRRDSPQNFVNFKKKFLSELKKIPLRQSLI